jgi:glycerophosphoryl diester phosphodiesterase
VPGNTFEAAINALNVGADVLEIDVHLTADNVLVVRHDAVIDTTTNGSGRIAQMTVAQIQAFDVGFHEVDYPDLVAPPGIEVPTLKSLFERMPENRYLIELKPIETAAADELCYLITDYDLADQVVVASFHDSVLVYFREICPTVLTSLGEREASWLFVLSKLGLGHLYNSPGYSVQLPMFEEDMTIVTPGLVRAIHQLNMRVEVWTINDPQTMQELMDMGVDSIITDRPDILERLVNPAL